MQLNFSHPDHYFNKNKQYKEEGITILKILLDKLSKKEIKSLLNGLQEKSNQFIENQYLQHAVESTINYFFKIHFEKFIYEPKAINKKKNMDCGIEIDNLKINFEVKCPSLSPKSDETLYIQAIGFKNSQIAQKKIEKSISAIKALSKYSYKQTLAYNEIGGCKNKSQDLLTLLKETNLKSIEEEVNILIVSLYSKKDFTEWVNYYWDILINKNNKLEFQNVDGIIFTNTINHHINNLELDSFPWSLEKHFLFFIRNTLKDNKNINLIEEKIKKIFGKNILLLQEEMIKFDKEAKSIVIFNIYRKIQKCPNIYSNDYIYANMKFFENEILECFYKHRKIFEKFGITNLKQILNEIYLSIPMKEKRIERLFLCSKLINNIESQEGINFFNDDKYIYKKEK